MVEPSARTLSASRRGALLCVAIFAFGALILWGMYLAPRAEAPAVPGGAAAQVPDRKLKFVSLDARHRHLATDPALAAVVELAPDYLFLQNVESEDVVPVAEVLGMQHSYFPQLYERSENFGGRHASWGNCVLARWPLYAGEPLTGASGAFGVWATSVVDGRRFVVASVHLTPGAPGKEEGRCLIDAWRAKDAPPIVIAGLLDGGLAADELVHQGTGWFDGLTPFLHLNESIPPGVPADARIVFSPGWSCLSGGAAGPVANNPAPLWVLATSARTANPTTSTGHASP